MNKEEALEKLEECGTEQNQKIYKRHGVTNEIYGVSYGDLNKLKREVNKDHELAEQLWKTNNHDAQIFATMIADPKEFSAKDLENWAKELENYVVTDAFSKLVGQTSLLKQKAEEWIKSKDEWTARTGWLLLTSLVKDENFEDSYFEPYLQKIEKDIHKAKNRVKDAMNMALIAIGARNSFLQKQALMIAEKIGKVEVDHGMTGCQTPDAAIYILKMAERNKNVNN